MQPDASGDHERVEVDRHGEAEDTRSDRRIDDPTNIPPTSHEVEQGESGSTLIETRVNNPTDILSMSFEDKQGLHCSAARSAPPTEIQDEPGNSVTSLLDDRLDGFSSTSDCDQTLSELPATDMFTHEPLQLDAASIRLVQVLPPGDDGMLRCAIIQTTLDKLVVQGLEVEYSCLSYVWGLAKPMRRISVNGRSFDVRQNLYDFLQMAPLLQRDHTQTSIHTRFQYVWIDALCIDQESTIERNHQVQQMGRIYLAAQKVIAWLGNDLDISALFRRISGPLARSRLEDMSGHRSYWPSHTAANKQYRKQCENDLLRDFHSHEYWQRAWITQEVILARDIHFVAQGYALGIGLSETSVEAFDLRDREESIALPRLDAFFQGLDYGPGLLDIVQNFELYRHKKCADVRDMVYSLLDISRDGSKLVVDYARSYVDLARDLLTLDDEGTCLCRVEIVLRGLRIYQESSEDASLLIEMKNPAMLRHMSPCKNCGERNALESISLPRSAQTRLRFICLHCNHYRLPELEGLHRRAHLGHLVFMPSKLNLEDVSAGLLLWSPQGGGWHRVTGYKRALVSETGRVESLALSVSAICEIISLVATQAVLLLSSTHESHQTSNWQVVS